MTAPTVPVVDVEAVFRDSYQYMRRIAYRRLGSWDDADDAAQEAFIQAWQERDRFVPSRTTNPAVAWVTTLTKYAALRIISQRKSHREVLAPAAAADDMGCERWLDSVAGRRGADRSTDDRPCLADPGVADELAARLAELPPANRQAIELMHLSGMGFREAARRAGLPHSTLADRARSGRARLARRAAGPEAVPA